MKRHRIPAIAAVTLFLPMVCLANPIVPSYRVFSGEAVAFETLKASILVVFIETLVLAAFFRAYRLPDHLIAGLSANVLSSIVGSFVFLTWHPHPPLRLAIAPLFFVMFVLAVLLEYPVIRWFYRTMTPPAVLKVCLLMNSLSYVVLWRLQDHFPHLFDLPY